MHTSLHQTKNKSDLSFKKFFQNIFSINFFTQIFQKPFKPLIIATCKHFYTQFFNQSTKQKTDFYKKFFSPQTLENASFQKILKKNFKKVLDIVTHLCYNAITTKQERQKQVANKKLLKSCKSVRDRREYGE